MKQGPLPLELSIQEFVNLINALEVGGFMHRHHLTSKMGKYHNQLSFDVSIAFNHLEHALQIGAKDLQVSREFNDFMRQLVTSARSNVFHPSAENTHAACLLGFMLYHNVQVKAGNEKRSFVELMYQHFPKEEAAYCQAAPLNGHHFLKPAWLASQNYPSIQHLLQIFNQHVQQQTLVKQIAEKKQAITAVLQAQNRFDHLTFTLNQFSFVLEAFIKIRNVNSNQPPLSNVVMQLMQQFSHQARQTQQPNLPTATQAQSHFIQMMKEIIAGAKYRQDYSSQFLLGFLLHHNFKLQMGNRILTMEEMFWSEATEQERRHIQYEGGQKLPFIHKNWQQQRGYPGKVQLEQAMMPTAAATAPIINNNVTTQKNYLPGYAAQQNAQKVPFVVRSIPFEEAALPMSCRI